jgi:AraC-like DNA-binding protein
MINSVPIQSLHTSDSMNDLLCNFNVEVFLEPTSPLIHPMSRLWLVNEGDGTVLINNKRYLLTKGSLVSVLPWQITDIVEVKEPLQFYVVEYHYESIHELAKAFFYLDGVHLPFAQILKDTPVITFDEDKYIEVQNLFHQFRDEARSINQAFETCTQDKEKGYSNAFVANKLIEILMLFFRSNRKIEKDTPMEVTDILGFMYMHLNEKITIPILAHKFFMSESAVRVYIKNTTGLTFYDLLNEMRVGKMISYLLYTNFTMEELAKILGFVDDAHICKVFKARMGMRENEFRNTYRIIGEKCQIQDQKVFYEVIEYIYRNHEEDLTLYSVSNFFKLSPKKLNSVLSCQVGMTFNDFLNFIRVNHASELLLETDKSMLTIALEVGYKTEKTLYRNFLQIRGMTGGEFRRTVELQKYEK